MMFDYLIWSVIIITQRAKTIEYVWFYRLSMKKQFVKRYYTLMFLTVTFLIGFFD